MSAKERRMGPVHYSVVDVETTGLRLSSRVVEVAVLGVNEGGKLVSAYESVVDPGRHPGPTWVHGITPAACRAAPSFRRIARELHHRLVGTVLVAHNLTFDWGFLREEMRRCGVVFLSEPLGLCTADASRSLGIPATLDAACAALGIGRRLRHCARADAEAAFQLWAALHARGAFLSGGRPLREAVGWHRLPRSAPPLPRSSVAKGSTDRFEQGLSQ